MWILSSLLFIAFLVVMAHGINWDDPSGNADEMISSGETAVITTPEPGSSSTPQKSRDAQKNKSSLDWTMPSTLAGNSDDAKASRSEANALSNDINQAAIQADTSNTSASAATSPTAETELPPSGTATAASPMTSVAGSWSFKLIDSIDRNLVLSLYQNKENVFGAGKIREANTTLDVSASGSVQNDTMDLAISSAGNVSLYKLRLKLGNETAYGDYQAYSASGESWNGSADGQMTASL
jgi:hypothetical protein